MNIKSQKITIGLIICSLVSLFLKNNINSISLIFLFLFVCFNFVTQKKGSVVYKLGRIDLKNELTYLILYFFLLIFSVFYSDNKAGGINYVVRMTPFLIMPICFFLIDKPKEDDKYLIRKIFVFSLSLLLFFLIFCAIYKNHQEGYSLSNFLISKIKSLFVSNPSDKGVGINFWLFSYEGLTSVIGIQPIYLSLFVNLGLVFLIVLKENARIKSIYFWALCLQFLFFSVLLSSRTGTFVFLLLIFSYILVVRKNNTFKKIVKNILVLTPLLLIFLLVVFYNPILKYRFMTMINPNYKHAYLNFSNQSIRLEIWKNSKDVFLESPFYGHGVGDYKKKLYDSYIRTNFLEGIQGKFNSHSQYLDTLLQMGLIGFSALVMIFCLGFFGPYRNLEKRYIYGVFALSFLTESMFDRHWGITSFTLFVVFISKYSTTK